MSMANKSPNLPSPSEVMAWDQFIELTGITPEHLQEIISLGWIEARTSGTETQLFRDADIYRVRKLERICCDFELPVIGGTIIVDLLERIDRLERLARDLGALGR